MPHRVHTSVCQLLVRVKDLNVSCTSVKTAVALTPNLTLCTGFFIVSGAWGGVVPDWAVGTCSLPGGLYFISFFKLGWTFFI